MSQALRYMSTMHDATPHITGILAHATRHSPYLAQLTQKYPEIAAQWQEVGPDAIWQEILAALTLPQEHDEPADACMQRLRHTKNRASLLIALADIGGAWPLETVTAALSQLAEHSLRAALRHILLAAMRKGEFSPADPAHPEQGSGIVILGMGKLGGVELNYSSDIDLMVFFDRALLPYSGTQTPQHFSNRLAQELVRLMQERTAEGYVFRTDLRLRPDPASTPPAISTIAGLTYYETVGQNWERAALIKARPVAGDLEAGAAFLKELSPFIWRKHLDFAAIDDIHSIKRQMNAKIGQQICMHGHHLKLGAGGIREIEFFTQIHQLIWGGRNPDLRIASTCDALRQLVKAKLVEAATATTLIESYRMLRTAEHRLQMVHDEQTHSLPAQEDALLNIAQFLGHKDIATFGGVLLPCLNAVHDIYVHSFKGAEELDSGGNLVFTGVDHDPETLTTIRTMGYANPALVSETIQGWHRGSRRATRTKRAREMITELTPTLLRALAGTAHPDSAFLKFDEFLSHLPAGVQLFSLFYQNPELLELIAAIMGSAPAIASHLSRKPQLLDVALSSDFYLGLPGKDSLKNQCLALLTHARDYEEALRVLRLFKQEKEFQAGAHLLRRITGGHGVRRFLSDLADTVLEALLPVVECEFALHHGIVPSGAFGILALGRLGAQEVTFGSDIDLIFLYDVIGPATVSDGEKPLNTSLYYNRLAQRVINALTSLMGEGKLYDVDTRLRPSGADGPLAVSLAAFEQYYHESAWTFECMALTKSRPLGWDTARMAALEDRIETFLRLPRFQEHLKRDVLSMREKIAAEFGTENPWDIKHVRGGVMDLDFLMQYLWLSQVREHRVPSPRSALAMLESGVTALPATVAATLPLHALLLHDVMTYLRLCSDGPFNEHFAAPGLVQMLTSAFGEKNIDGLKARLATAEETIYHAFRLIVEGAP